MRQATTGTTGTARTARERLAELVPQPPVEVISTSVLRTRRFHLRPLCESDRDEFIRVIRLSRAHLDRFSALHLPEETDEQLFERQLGLTQRGEASGLSRRRVAVDSSGRIVGSFNLNSITRGLTWAGDLNWWVSVDSLRRGFATECVGAIVTHALRDLPHGLGLHEVHAFVQRENGWSIRIAEKLGFVKEGDERAHLQTGDKWHVHELYVRRVRATK
ncbi:MAG: GNAT family N-acetyltransferase [Planctomycetes bacterium]|nr:GNAT family N-acetyltransferase [Planctomycetota bacterium]